MFWEIVCKALIPGNEFPALVRLLIKVQHSRASRRSLSFAQKLGTGRQLAWLYESAYQHLYRGYAPHYFVARRCSYTSFGVYAKLS